MMGKRQLTASALPAPDWESCAPREVAERQGVTTGYARMLPVLKRQIISASATLERERDAERDLKRMLHSRNNTDQPYKQEHAQSLRTERRAVRAHARALDADERRA